MNDVAVMNEVVREEIRRQQARRRAKAELDRTIRASRERQRAERMEELRRKYNRKPTLLQRLWRPVEDTWCMFWVILLLWPDMLINLCLKKGWIEKV